MSKSLESLCKTTDEQLFLHYRSQNIMILFGGGADMDTSQIGVYSSLEDAFRLQPESSVSRVQEEILGECIASFLLKGSQKGPVLWIQAALHGDEYDGIITCLKIIESIDLNKMTGSIVLLPIVNPGGFLSGNAANPKDQINLNRVFGATSGASYSFLFGKWLANQIVTYADAFVDLHGGGKFLDVCPFAMVADSNEEAWEQAIVLLKKLDLAAIYRGGEQISGMLIHEVCKQGIPAILLEDGGGLEWDPHIVERQLHKLCVLMESLGMLMPDITNHSRQCAAPVVKKVVELYAPATGLQTEHTVVGSYVSEGEVLLEITDYPDFQVHQIKCPVKKGIILSIHSAALINKEDYAVMIGSLEE